MILFLISQSLKPAVNSVTADMRQNRDVRSGRDCGWNIAQDRYELYRSLHEESRHANKDEGHIQMEKTAEKTEIRK